MLSNFNLVNSISRVIILGMNQAKIITVVIWL